MAQEKVPLTQRNRRGIPIRRKVRTNWLLFMKIKTAKLMPTEDQIRKKSNEYFNFDPIIYFNSYYIYISFI